MSATKKTSKLGEDNFFEFKPSESLKYSKLERIQHTGAHPPRMTPGTPPGDVWVDGEAQNANFAPQPNSMHTTATTTQPTSIPPLTPLDCAQYKERYTAIMPFVYRLLGLHAEAEKNKTQVDETVERNLCLRLRHAGLTLEPHRNAPESPRLVAKIDKLTLLLEKSLQQKPGNPPEPPPNPTASQTWAELLRKSSPKRHDETSATVAITPNELARDPELFCKEVMQSIPNVAGLRKLKNGTYLITMMNLADKERVLRERSELGPRCNARIQAQDFPVHISYFPLSVDIDHSKTATNNDLIREIQEECRPYTGPLAITRIQRHRGDKPRKNWRPDGPGPKACTIIVYFAKKDMQEAVVRKGLRFRGSIYEEVMVWDASVGIRQCSNCYGLGHTTNRCTKEAVCGCCRGPHRTADCMTPEATLCVNCRGTDHKAWQRATCPRWTKPLIHQNRLKQSLMERTHRIRNPSIFQQATPPPPSPDSNPDRPPEETWKPKGTRDNHRSGNPETT
ncbi:hypothetical protein EJ06DRAFT_281477 [Trichodelitschia bisporula]|uniref:CCHC-type domain-containing protein n=1 Tax=Trichodelitschia bisporula TaxID=703511 RepID=A0A6G1I5F8_9PEZI|nr:hypothetical protein EJ06DRAFT_281477 [Trichodelitschia bisporula]